MAEVSTPMRVIKLDYLCDQCERGAMMSDGIPDGFSNPPKFLHTCSLCGCVQTLNKPYPAIQYLVIEATPSPVHRSV